MSAKLYSPSGNNASLQGITMGGSKPLHRFIKGQPKVIGVVVLVLGSSFFLDSIVIMRSVPLIWSLVTSGLLLGILLMMCGILFILTEHNPTKKTVSISLALSIVTILGACWTILQLIPSIISDYYYRHHHYDSINGTDPNEIWSSYYLDMGRCVEGIYMFYSIVSIIILIVMSALAGAALRSTKTQAVVMMTITPTETPVE